MPIGKAEAPEPALSPKQQRRAYILLQRISKRDRLIPSERRAKYGRGYGIHQDRAWREQLRGLVGDEEFSDLMTKHTRQRVRLEELEKIIPETGITR